MSTVAGARAELYALLVASGLDMTQTTGGAVPPQCFIVANDPWVEPATLLHGSRNVRFTVVCLIGSASDEAIVETADALANALSLAGDVSTWSLPVVSAPSAYEVGGLTYLAIKANIESMIQK